MHNPSTQTSLVILYSLLWSFYTLFFRSLDRLLSKRQDKSQLLSPCDPFSSALKQVWSDDVGQRSY